jgi:hypothetical protein
MTIKKAIIDLIPRDNLCDYLVSTGWIKVTDTYFTLTKRFSSVGLDILEKDNAYYTIVGRLLRWL